jgi:hypothetical protein
MKWVGIGGVTLAAAVLLPTLASAGGTSGSPAPAAPIVSQDAGGEPRLHGWSGFGFGGHGFRGHGFRGHWPGGAGAGVLEQLGLDREDARAALQAVREQFPREDRPQVDRPPTDEQKAELQAYFEAQQAAFAEALGIPLDEFQAAVDQARDERSQRFQQRRSTYQSALADALGITVEQLRAAQDQARAALKPPTGE